MKHFYIDSHFTNPFKSRNISDGYRLLAFRNWTGNYPMLLEMQEIDARLTSHIVETKHSLKLWELIIYLRGNNPFLDLVIKHFGLIRITAAWYSEFFNFLYNDLAIAQNGLSPELVELLQEKNASVIDFLPFEDLISDYYFIKKQEYDSLKFIKIQEV